MRKRSFVGCLCVSMGMLLVASNGFASDPKTYPGTNCVLKVPFPVPNPAPALGYDSGAITNPTTVNAFVYCPIVKKAVNTGINSGYVIVKDQNAGPNTTTTNIQCTLFSAFANPGATTFEFFTSGSNGTSGGQ